MLFPIVVLQQTSNSLFQLPIDPVFNLCVSNISQDYEARLIGPINEDYNYYPVETHMLKKDETFCFSKKLTTLNKFMYGYVIPVNAIINVNPKTRFYLKTDPESFFNNLIIVVIGTFALIVLLNEIYKFCFNKN
ncbi:MAG: hypothetical protein NTY48_05105 [Candidatus Diapherotrites archaeon]|nr:hypothetical protein [Candidatus Diapherotrites archaeon]